ncbi:enolase C-terminal domain-like protein [Leifsonia shinshuensis]|uniref:L-alanine-DL-glutamate epimerase-like enolase superfamily enzyme n=1 Tax=Leifsonia shinshuensis TaxID=150026 RepID=A0A853CQW1_9MICO|nr:enolase C-terminal domain-like protein [Leifsonia shinshuensis]NYJ22812.1 L-alanine-DL-glutamate epimerase-like enolase superfamily enzyme [Leifsonia shinshuensis]
MPTNGADRIRSIRADAYVVPTATEGRRRPESDGTIEWTNTGVLLVAVEAGDATGLGYAYTAPASLRIVEDVLWAVVDGADPFDTERLYWELARAVRNVGWAGVSAGAIAALDIALHDLKARLSGMSLTRLLGGAHDGVAAYGSGGFTDYTDDELTDQLGSWAAAGLGSVKMKVGSRPDDDPRRVALAREAIGPDVDLFVDANGAYERKRALRLGELFAEQGVTWFEEPVSSQDRHGLRLLRDRLPAPIRVAAGEYGYTPADFRDLLADGCVDVLQADATRCGITGFGIAASLATAFGVPLSAHTAPALHASVAAAHRPSINIEYFHDHVRIEERFFDGLPALSHGRLLPDRTAPGHGLTLRESDVEPYRVHRFAAAG